jgi:hypothetical protein
MMRRMLRMVVVVLFVACSHNEAKPVAPTPVAPTAASGSGGDSATAVAAADSAPCDEVAVHVIRISRTSGDTKPLTEMMRRHCNDDLWSADARKCYLTANSWDEGIACEPKLTAAQVKLLSDDLEAHGSTMGHASPQP